MASLWGRSVIDALRTVRRERHVASLRGGVFADWHGDVRQVLRGWLRRPGLFLTMASTLALGIGLSAGVFAFADGYLFRRLPFPAADQLYFLRDPNARIAMSAADAVALRQSDIAEFGFVEWSVAEQIGHGMTIGDRQIEFLAYEIGPGFRETVPLPLVAGRDFTAGDHVGAGRLPVWLSFRFWQREFGGDRDVVNRVFGVAGGSTSMEIQVVGILSPLVTSFDLNNPPPDLVVPRRRPEVTGPNRLAFPIVRLPDGMTPQQGEARIAATLQAIAPGSDGKTRAARLRPLLASQTAGGKPTARVFFIGALLVLLLASINLAHLLMTRSLARSEEIAVRAALGATRWRLGRLFLTESLLLAAVGISGGLLLGYGLSEVMAARVPVFPTAGRNLSLVPMVFDGRVVGFAAMLGLVVTCLGAVFPAWRALRRPAVVTSRYAAGVSAMMPARMSRVMLTSELAVATAVIVGASFMGLGIWRYLNQPLGFDYAHRFRVSFTPVEARRSTPVEVDSIVRVVAAVPGVELAAPSGFQYLRGVEVPGRAIDPQSVQPVATSPGFYEAWNLRLSSGRWFAPEEFAQDGPVAVVDRQFAAAVWPDVDPLGQEVRVGAGPLRRVVGVIEPMKTRLDANVPGNVIIPAALPGAAGSIVAWAPAMPFAELRRHVVPAVQRVLPGATVRIAPVTFDGLFARDAGEAQFQAPIMAVFGILAFVLAGVGVFGLVSYLVEQRTREFGIRMTLGARPADIWRVVVGHCLRPAIAGLLIGIGGAWALESIVRSAVFGWQSSGPQTIAFVAAALLSLAVFAAAVPARRAMRLDPAKVLRAE